MKKEAMGLKKIKKAGRRKTIEKQSARKKYWRTELVIDYEKEDKKIVLLSCLVLFLFGVYQSILLYGHHIMPSPDFPSFIDVGRKLWSFQIPTNYQRAPVYGLIVYPLSLIVGGQHPELTAAWLFNSILQPCNLVLIYLAGKKVVGNSAFWLAMIAILNPWLIEVFTKPIAEICLLFFMLITFFFMFRRSNLCYLLASIATMVRYECAALILAAFVMDMIHRKSRKEKIYAFCYSVLASIPLGIWMIGTMYFFPDKNGTYVHPLQFINIGELFKVATLKSQLNLLWYSIIGPLFRPGLNPGENLLNMLATVTKLIAALSFIFGAIWGLVKKQWNILALLIFLILYMIVHISYAYSEPRFYTPVQWILLLICLYGIKSFWQLVNANNRIPRYVTIGAQIAVLIVALVWFSRLAGYLPEFSSISPRSVSLPYAAIAASILAVAGIAFIYRGKHSWRNIVILSVVSLMIVSNQFTVAGVIRDGTQDGEFRQLLDWYRQNAKPGEKLVSTLSSLLSVLDPKDKDCFLVTGDLKADSPEGFIDNCYKEGVTYIAWDSRVGFSTNDVFYTLARLDNIAMLRNPKSTGPYEYITTIVHPTQKNRFINIFRLRPRPVQHSGN